MTIKSKCMVALLTAAAAFAAAPLAAHAALINVSTSGGTATDTSFTVNDPDVGTYTVTVSGFGKRAQASDNFYYFRNSSNLTEDDDTITFTVSGLDPSVGYISSFALTTVKVTPSVGSGTAVYTTTLSGTDVNTAGTVSVSSSGPSNYNVALGDGTNNFGSSPAFSLFIDEQPTFTTRTIGVRDFAITAVPVGGVAVPEPASLSLLGLAGATLLLRRRRHV